MRTLLAALAGLAFLAGCDPTQKDDMSCTATFHGVADVCSQLHITAAEGVVAKQKCENEVGGSWSSHACPSANRVPGGYCKVEASQYSLSGTDVKVYFYSPATLVEAQAACSQAGGTWISG